MWFDTELYELLNAPPSFYHLTVFPIQHSPLLPSFFPKPRFHFHISAESAGSLRVLMQQAEGSEAILWSRSHNTVSHWTAESLLLGLHQQPYKVCAHVSTKQLNLYTRDTEMCISFFFKAWRNEWRNITNKSKCLHTGHEESLYAVTFTSLQPN